MPTLSAGRTSRGSQAGVTLIEMLVVVGIIGIIAAITGPSVAAGLDAVRMASATQSVAAFINGAVNRAERRQQPIELVISLKENKFTMYSNEPGFVRELKLPDGIAIDAVLPAEEEVGDGIRRLILMPGASVPGIGVQLINRRGGKRRIKLDPMTGFPHTEIVTAE
jgi:prepilin-type N-terminal cleavage/methylation domain-containing protein